MMFLYYVLALLSTLTASVESYSEDLYDNEANITLHLDVISDGLVFGLDDVLQFNCWIDAPTNDFSLNNIFLLIDNSTNSTKMDRVTTTVGPAAVEYQFNITQPSDNGIQFTCILAQTPFSDPIAYSDTIELEVEYAPIFDKGNDVTLYHYVKPGMDSSMSCAINASNPPISSFTVTNNSHNSANVHVNYSTKIISITNAITNNSGTYTCTATNENGTSYLSHTTFIGGAPDSVDISVFTAYSNDTLTVSIGIIDDSQSPAHTLTVGVYGVHEQVIDLVAQGYTLPVRNQEMIALTVPLDMVYTAKYNVFVTADNPLGSTNVFSKPLYIEGTRSANVLLEGQLNVTSGNDYRFKCLLDVNGTSYPGFNLTVAINGSTTGQYFNRLVVGESVFNNYQVYTFINTTYQDNGLVFSCLANSVYSSQQSSMDVLFSPRFDVSGWAEPKYFNYGQDSYIRCTVQYSNPSVSLLYVSNTSRDTSNIKVDVTVEDSLPTALINFTNARVSNRGIYSCIAVNEIGSTIIHYNTFIGGVPANLTVDVMPVNQDKSIMVGLGLTDTSDAPASSLDIQLEGVGSYSMKLSPSQIPLDHTFQSMFIMQQDQVYVGNYGLSISGSNSIGDNPRLYTSSIYLEGTAVLDVYLQFEQSSVIEGRSFTFSCLVDDTINATVPVVFDVLINGKSNTSSHSRLKSTFIDNFMTNFTLMKSNYMDDGISFTCRVNRFYLSDKEHLTVYYAPIVSVPSLLGGFLNQSLIINITVHSNPSKYSVKWLKDNTTLPSDVTSDRNGLYFKSMSATDNGIYTVIATNGILNGTRQSFKVLSYDGPYFNDGASNSSILAENKIGSNFQLKCTVKHAYPAVDSLTFIPETGPNWKIKRNGTESVILEFTGGNIANNTRPFKCEARNNLTVATLQYNNYIGDVPKDTIVKVDKHDNGSAIILSLNVTDNNSAPLTEISYYIEGIDQHNSSLRYPYLNKSFVFGKVRELSYQQLGGSGATNYLFVHAKNLIGSVLVLKYNFTTPSGNVSNNKGLTIGLGVGIPVAAVLVVLVIVGLAIYYKIRKSKRRQYAVLIDDDNAVGGRGSINKPTNDYDSI